jgi:hypothetical protein
MRINTPATRYQTVGHLSQPPKAPEKWATTLKIAHVMSAKASPRKSSCDSRPPSTEGSTLSLPSQAYCRSAATIRPSLASKV